MDGPTKLAYDSLKEGKCVHLKGMAGAGKSTALYAVARKLFDDGEAIACTASTGIAATRYGASGLCGQTLHSFSGIRLGQEPAEVICKRLKKEKDGEDSRVGRIRAVSYLFIDEISMLRAETLDLVDEVFRALRKNDAPFGGIVLAIAGDFLQLRPVTRSNEPPAPLAFESSAFKACNFVKVEFTELHRFKDDPEWGQILRRVRVGQQTKEDLDVLASRVMQFDEEHALVKPTMLFPLKRDVADLNSIELAKLPGEAKTYVATDACSHFCPAAFLSQLDEDVPREVQLKEGAQVMITRNLTEYIVNGTRGVVKKMGDRMVTITLVSGAEYVVTPVVWRVGKSELRWASRTQMPLILAWGLTIHKSQGSSLDCVRADVGNKVFDPGMAFVALSRARTRAGLTLSAFDPAKIRVDPKALAYEEDDEKKEAPRKKRRVE